jgi:transposase
LVRQQATEEPLYYASQDIAKPASGNFYMRLNEAVGDWQKLAKPFEVAFAKKMGRPTDPAVYLKIYLVGYLENITYDTDLAERIGDSIAIRRFLGYTLSESPPDHSSISRNRALISRHCRIEDVLARVVELCQKEGLVDGDLAAVDSSLIPANASLSSLKSVKTGKRVAEHLREVAEKNKVAEELEEPMKPKKPTIPNNEFRSATDPDARIAKKPGQPRDMCYKATHVTDGKNGVIIAAGATHADEGEVRAAGGLLLQAKENLARCGISLEKVTADAGYDSTGFYTYVEGLGAVPITNWRADTTKKPEGFKKESFVYYEEADCYICPRGCILSYESFCRPIGLHLYRSRASDCANCPHREVCIDGKGNVRRVSRHPNEASRERNIERYHTDEGRSILRKRKWIVEPPFGHMKTYGGLRLISCRGIGKAHVKVVMAAVAYDLIKLVAAKARKSGLLSSDRTLITALRAYLRAFRKLMAAKEMIRDWFTLRPRVPAIPAQTPPGWYFCDRLLSMLVDSPFDGEAERNPAPGRQKIERQLLTS